MKTTLLIALRTLPILISWLIYGVSIQSLLAADDFAASKQRWALALVDVQSPDPSRHQSETWWAIDEIVKYCPHHPELIDTLFSVLNDDTRRDDWEQAIMNIHTAVQGDARLSKSHVDKLTQILPQIVIYKRGSCIGLLGLQKENAAIAIAAVRPYLASDESALSTRAASSVLRLSPTDQEAQRVLLTLATSQTIKDRRCAVYWMGKSGVDTPQFREALRVAMKDSDSGVRVLSSSSFWEITKSAEESLPVLRASLDDESVFIEFGATIARNVTYPSQHVSTINCLGEMATIDHNAKQLLEDIAMKKITVEDAWASISDSLIRSNGRVKYGVTSFQEAAVRTALADDGVFSEIARKRLSKLTTVELKAKLKLFSAFRKQDAVWSEASKLP